jgi:hypothetical protein
MRATSQIILPVRNGIPAGFPASPISRGGKKIIKMASPQKMLFLLNEGTLDRVDMGELDLFLNKPIWYKNTGNKIYEPDLL